MPAGGTPVDDSNINNHHQTYAHSVSLPMNSRISPTPENLYIQSADALFPRLLTELQGCKVLLRDILSVYNKITEACFQRCASNFNQRQLTRTEEQCIENCGGKFIHGNHTIVSTFMQIQTYKQQQMMDEATQQQQQQQLEQFQQLTQQQQQPQQQLDSVQNSDSPQTE